MGTDIVSRVAHMRGIEIGAISELNPQAAGRAVTIAYGDPDRAMATETTDSLNAAIEAGRIATTRNVHTLLDSGLIDVVIDATGIPSVGAEIGLAAMECGKHLVMMCR
jgi:predicted homoserine dehydrogenase-like protein